MSENAELQEAVEILGHIQNLDEVEEAREFVRLWIKSINNGLESMKLPILDEIKIVQHIHDVDARIEA